MDEHAHGRERTHPEDAPHEHGGRVHTHHGRERPPDPLVLSLDKHIVLSGPVVPAPLPARDLDSVSPGAAAPLASLSVETPPPRRRV